MTLDMLEEALRHPRPLTLFLTDGRKIDIPHPEFAWLVPPGKASLYVSRGKGQGVEYLRVNQIVSLLRPEDDASLNPGQGI